MFNLLEHSDTCLKTSGRLLQYCRGESALNHNDNIINFPNDSNNRISFKFKQEIKRQTGNNEAKYVEIKFPLKYLSNFWRVIEMQLIKCEISLTLT